MGYPLPDGRHPELVGRTARAGVALAVLEIKWGDRQVWLDITRAKIKASPPWHAPSTSWTRLTRASCTRITVGRATDGEYARPDTTFESMFVLRGAPVGKRGQLQIPRWDGTALRFAYHGADHVLRPLLVEFSLPPIVAPITTEQSIAHFSAWPPWPPRSSW